MSTGEFGDQLSKKNLHMAFRKCIKATNSTNDEHIHIRRGLLIEKRVGRQRPVFIERGHGLMKMTKINFERGGDVVGDADADAVKGFVEVIVKKQA